eukprot:RCo014509
MHSCKLPHLQGTPNRKATTPPAERAFRKTAGIKPTWHGPVFVPETSLLRCGRCGQNVDPITRVIVGEKPYHPRCLVCFKCGEASESIFMDYDGRPVCTRCSRQLPPVPRPKTLAITEGKCKKCMQPLEGKIVAAMGFRWHSTCFRCAACGKDFEADGAFGERGGKPYHVSCARRLSAPAQVPLLGMSPCSGCGKLVQGDHVALSRGPVYHRHCLRCSVCKAQIMGTRFAEHAQTGQPLCMRCNVRGAS